MSDESVIAAQLAALDDLTVRNAYPADVVEALVKPYSAYLAAAASLRALDLGEQPGAFTFRPGGRQ